MYNSYHIGLHNVVTRGSDMLLLRAGQPLTKEKVICIHEEDAGMLWKHTEMRSMQCETRRARRLVFSTIATLGNYVRSQTYLSMIFSKKYFITKTFYLFYKPISIMSTMSPSARNTTSHFMC